MDKRRNLFNDQKVAGQTLAVKAGSTVYLKQRANPHSTNLVYSAPRFNSQHLSSHFLAISEAGHLTEQI